MTVPNPAAADVASPVAEALAAYRRALPPGELLTFPLTSADRLGVPVQTASFFPAAEPGTVKSGTGYGATDAAALTGALGELTEEFGAARALRRWPRQVASYRQLAAREGAARVVDPLTLCLEAGSPYAPDLTLEWVIVRRLRDGGEVFVPVEFVACTPGALGPAPAGVARLVTPITNGLGAGLSFARAAAHGLLELVQRDGNGLRIRALATTTALDPASVVDPEARALLDRLAAGGVEAVVKVAATDFGFTSFYVTGGDRTEADALPPAALLAGGEAVHPVTVRALRKALLEFAAARSRLAFFHGPLAAAARVAPAGYLEGCRRRFDPAEEEPRALEEMRRWTARPPAASRELLRARVWRTDTLVPFDALPGAAEPTDEAGDQERWFRLVVDRLEAAGFDPLAADFSEPGGGVHALKVIVPGLEVETMSYGRIGERNVRRLVELGTVAGAAGPLAGVGDPAPAGARAVRLTREAEARLGGPAWLDRKGINQVVGELYPLYREPGRHAVTFTGS